MKTLRYIGLALAFAGVLVFVGGVYYSLSRTAKVHINGTDTKRMDESGGDEQLKSRDVRFVYATDITTKQAMVFRNEDTGWGFPFYLKFNSGDIAATAMSMAQNDQDAVVLVTYYGVRIPMFDAFPNVLSLKIVEPDYVHIPVFNIVFLLVLLGVVVFLSVRARKLFRAVGDKVRGSPKTQ